MIFAIYLFSDMNFRAWPTALSEASAVAQRSITTFRTLLSFFRSRDGLALPVQARVALGSIQKFQFMIA
jgi:hypothetical protein